VSRHPGAALDRRRAGVLLHPTSLPGPRGGDLGAESYRFVDLLAAAGISVWQVLPLGPTHDDGSPYLALSVHAGNPRLISLEALVDRGWLDPADLARPAAERHGHQHRCLRAAYAGFERHASAEDREAFAGYVREQSHWLDDYALYVALREKHDHRAWMDWPAALRHREPKAVQQARARLASEVEVVRFEQFLFHEQWSALKRYANERGMRLFGDLPIFVAHDSVDVWANRAYFDVDTDGRARVVAGVPPDYFSATGQRWGNPHYRWDMLAADGFRWWVERMRTQLALLDIVRIDHFRGFEAYWEIPAESDTAIGGHWVKAPGDALFARLREELGELALVAEDLGQITEEVHHLRRRYGLPGMKILQFAFDGGPDNPYLPHNHEIDSVVYTGTHDNDTTLGWYQSLEPESRARVLDYLGSPSEEMPWALIRCALASVAALAVVPLQDVLALGSEHRMNSPGTNIGNWQWRFKWDQIDDEAVTRLRHLVALYGR
jgi:4-alpha-glucanotransferase